MKEKTKWEEPSAHIQPRWKWSSKGFSGKVYFADESDLRWVSLYSEKIGNTMYQRAGQIIGDE